MILLLYAYSAVMVNVNAELIGMQRRKEVNGLLTAAVERLIFLAVVHDLGQDAAQDLRTRCPLFRILLLQLCALLIQCPHGLVVTVV